MANEKAELIEKINEKAELMVLYGEILKFEVGDGVKVRTAFWP